MRMVTPPFTSRAVAGVVVWTPKKLEVVLKNKLVVPWIPVDVPVASKTLPEVVDPEMVVPPESATPFT